MWGREVQWDPESTLQPDVDITEEEDSSVVSTSEYFAECDRKRALEQKMQAAKAATLKRNQENKESERQRLEQERDAALRKKSEQRVQEGKTNAYEKLLWEICPTKAVESLEEVQAKKDQARSCFDRHRRKEIAKATRVRVEQELQKQSRVVSLQPDVVKNRIGPLIPKRRHCHAKNKASYRGCKLLPWEMSEGAHIHSGKYGR
eukprot:TRINITY_DN23204_c0_g1_i1.p1 TRINITY_DN23204_c0_g1~~TRINITY_DN23204_c0_g1_i1.p1  ORF type:complete len:222 (+),score=44.04 TRINITY_DN23204_c0_g1_i1:57-668(+)